MSLHDLKTAIRLHRNGKLKAAHEAYCNLVQERPDDRKIISLLGQLQLQMGKTGPAIENLRRAASMEPEDQRILLTLARGLATTGNHGEAIGIVHKVLAKDDSSADAWSALAAVHRHHDDHANELVALERAMELVPDDVPVLIAKANAEVANGYLEKAIETLQHAATQAPRNARIANNLGALHLRRNNLEAAEAAFQQSLSIAPDYSVAVANLAATLHRMGKLESARDIAEHALKLLPESVSIRAELASILLAQGDLAGAEAGFMAALELAPAHQSVIAGIAALREKQGRSAEGLQLISDVINSNKVSANIRLVGATLAHRIGRREVVLEMLGPLLDADGDPKESLDRVTRRRLCFLLGDIYDASADCRTALRHYASANGVLKPQYDVPGLYQYVDAIVESFDADLVRKRKQAVSRAPRRIFIVGIPRSGISLIESMLAKHPEIHVCGELSLLGRLVNENAMYPRGINDLSEADMNRFGDRYCAATAAPTEIRWMTDKMPLNFFYLGAIAQMLPDSLIVHCRRFPADMLLSCYFQNFSDPALGFSFDLENLQHFWRNYNRLMRHWQSIMGDMIFDMDYEELVTDPESVMRELLVRLDLEWNWEVLNPKQGEQHDGPVSLNQEIIHSRSVGRFARYRPFWGDRPDFRALSGASGPKHPAD